MSARAIQSKRIHSLSTARVGVLAWAVAALGPGCGGGSGGGTPLVGDRELVPALDSVGLEPGRSGPVPFVLTIGGDPAPGQTVDFSIPDTIGAQGATLAASSVVTDTTGTAVALVLAGKEAMFQIHASSGGAERDVFINVATGEFGAITVVPLVVEKTSEPVKNVEVKLYEGHTCAEIAVTHPPNPGANRVQLFPLLLGSASFSAVSTGKTSAVLGHGLSGATTVLATGCVDVPGTSLLAGGVVSVQLPLEERSPDPTGTYSVASTFLFSPPLPVAAAVAAPWRDLADCPLDPAQLWLDCTIDALAGPTADDPLDCVPSAAPGGEGTLGDALGAARGALLVDPAQITVGCRGGKTATGDAGLEAVVLGLFGTPLPHLVAVLPAIASDATHLLDLLALASTLVVQRGSAPSTYVVTHTLESASFGLTEEARGRATTRLAPLALPALTAYAGATASDGTFSIGSHGFTLRLGTVARAALGASLVARGLPADAPTFIQALASLAGAADGSLTGCAAMDAALCPRVGYPIGCLASACAAGLDALADRLTHAFDPAEGTGIDFTLEGSAPIVLDPHGSGVADRAHLGVTGSGNSSGTWNAVLRTTSGRTAVPGSFASTREN